MATSLYPSVFFAQVTLCALAQHVSFTPKNDNCSLDLPTVNSDWPIPWTQHMTSPESNFLETTPPAQAYKNDRINDFFRGHGGTAMATSLYPSVFFAQVGDKHFYTSFHSDCRGIVVLPCPATCACLFVDAWTVILILLAGDVEQNPGPNTDDLIKMMNTMLASQEELKTKIENLATAHDKLESTVNARMDDVMVAIKEQKVEIKALQTEVTALKVNLQLHQRRLDDLEDRSRRRNLVIFGFPEPGRENATELRKKIIEELIGDKLGVVVNSVERVHRVGKKRHDKVRPVLMNFFDYNEKLKVLKNCHKLKGTKISVNHDFCKATIAKRSKLWSHSNDFRAQGRKVSLDYDKLRVDDDIYEWDEQKDCLKCIRPQRNRDK
nr:protein unc-13 homolog C-like [Rhipicephalus microplus]